LNRYWELLLAILSLPFIIAASLLGAFWMAVIIWWTKVKICRSMIGEKYVWED
jgi:hypothetical protein